MHVGHLRQACFGQAVFPALAGERLISDKRGDHEGIVFHDQACSGVVDEIAMLDRAHAAAHRACNGIGRVDPM